MECQGNDRLGKEETEEMDEEEGCGDLGIVSLIFEEKKGRWGWGLKG